MVLEKLILHNFKGIPDYTFTANGRSVNVYGDNETGKTTLADAEHWLLTDQDMSGRSPLSFGIKTREITESGELGEPFHNLEHSVEGVYDLFTLKKIYKENWTGKADKKTLDSHTVDYFFDGVPVTKTEYREKIRKVMTDEWLKILSDPLYFAGDMHWTDRRRILTEFAGEITTEDIIRDKPDLSRYPDILGDKSEDGIKRVLEASRKALLEQIKDIPTRIDEATRQLVEIDDLETAKKKVSELDDKRADIEQQISKLKSGGGIADLKIRIEDLEADKKQLSTKHDKENDQALHTVREKVNKLQNGLDDLQADRREAERSANEKRNDLDSAISELESKKEHLKTQQDKTAKPKPKEQKPCPMGCPPSCPECGVNLLQAQEPDENNYEVYIEAFNKEKAESIKDAKLEVQKEEEAIKDYQMAFDEAKEKWAKLSGKEKQHESALKNAEKQLKTQKEALTPVTDLDTYKELSEAQEELQSKITEFESEREQEIQQLEKQDKETKEQQTKYARILMQDETNRRIKNRISELEQQRKEAAENLEQVEEDLYLLDRFEKARSEIVTDRINDKFQTVKWQMFKYQVDGQLDPNVCEAVYKGVPFNEGLNNAGKVQAGVDIINTLSRHYKKSRPVWIDNRESVIELPDNELQIINLYVDKEQPKLKVEFA